MEQKPTNIKCPVCALCAAHHFLSGSWLRQTEASIYRGKRLWCRQRVGCVSHRAIISMAHALATTTVLLSAETKASLVANAVEPVAAAFAQSFANFPLSVLLVCSLLPLVPQ
ncbi:hypothetical protein CUMW_038320 [Citrus unshiu]|nr:hypothetical protein CUMW_038320 [Citrus unshiu]